MMTQETAAEILDRSYGIKSTVESGRLICLLDISQDNVYTVRSILKEIGYNKTWGIRPKREKLVGTIETVVLDEDAFDGPREKHVL